MLSSLRSRFRTIAGAGAAVGALTLSLLCAAPAHAAAGGLPAYVPGGDSIPQVIGTWGNPFRLTAGSGAGARALTVEGGTASMRPVGSGSDQVWRAYRTGPTVQDSYTTGRRPIVLANYGADGQARCLQIDPAGNAGLDAAVQVVACNPTAPSPVQTWLVPDYGSVQSGTAPDYGSIQGTIVNLASFHAANAAGAVRPALLASASVPSIARLVVYVGQADAQLLRDVQVPPARNVAAGATVVHTTSSEEWGPWSAARLTDGVRTSTPANKGYTSGANYVNDPYASAQTVMIDLAAQQAITSVVLYPRTATGGEAAATTGAGFPSTVEIRTSNDNVVWTRVLWTKVLTTTGQDADNGQPRTYTLPAGTHARYIQVTGRLLGRIAPDDSVWRLQLAEIEVYAP